MEEKNKQQCELINELKKSNKQKEKKIRKFKKAYNKIKKEMYELDDALNQKVKYKDEINIVYEMEEDGDCNLFGEKFVENNKDNIDLVINGVKNNLTNKYALKKGENIVKMIIKNNITNLSKMFCKCDKIKNIDDLKYLNSKYFLNLEGMFIECSSLTDLKPLESWDVSNVENFKSLFINC